MQPDAERQARRDSQSDTHRRRERYNPHHVAPLGTERNSDTQFARALHNGVRDHAVQAHSRQ